MILIQCGRYYLHPFSVFSNNASMRYGSYNAYPPSAVLSVDNIVVFCAARYRDKHAVSEIGARSLCVYPLAVNSRLYVPGQITGYKGSLYWYFYSFS